MSVAMDPQSAALPAYPGSTDDARPHWQELAAAVTTTIEGMSWKRAARHLHRSGLEEHHIGSFRAAR